MNTIKYTGNKNFTRQLAIYAEVTLLFAVLTIGAKVINWNLWQPQQITMLVNLALVLGFIIYLGQLGYKLDPNTRINDKAALYWVCFWISLIVISSFHRPDIGWTNNVSLNVWLIAETLLIAASDEIVFRSFGDWCFPVKGRREEAVMIICYAVFYSYCFADGTAAGLMGIALAIGMGFLFTGLYLRFHKLGANILYHFLLIYLARVTEINSSGADTILGNASVPIFCVGVLGMIWYGIRLIGVYNREGVSADPKSEDSVDLLRTFSESRDKYKEKVINKAQPAIDKSNDKRMEKLIARAEKQEAKKAAKREAKEKAKRGKTDD